MSALKKLVSVSSLRFPADDMISEGGDILSGDMPRGPDADAVAEAVGTVTDEFAEEDEEDDDPVGTARRAGACLSIENACFLRGELVPPSSSIPVPLDLLMVVVYLCCYACVLVLSRLRLM